MADRIERHRSAASQRSIGSQRTLRRRESAESNVNVFGDEFSFESMGVVDGFRPTQMTETTTPYRDVPTPSRPRTPPRMSMNARRSMMAQTSQDSKSDAAKKRIPSQAMNPTVGSRNSFSLRYDATDSPQQRIPSMAQTDVSRFSERPVSSISGFSIPRTQSPFVGASGPSHPYGMYPQDTSLNRTSTVSSLGPRTPAPERQYSGPSQPTHPYGMYPQTTAPEPEADPLAESADIASVGFPGLSRPYARRLGPDGEEADDIIGPDGHTESLPPYTRYPQALPSKERYAPESPSEEASSSHPPILDASSNASESLLEGTTQAGDEESSGSPAERPHRSTKEVWTEKSKKRTCFGTLPRWTVGLSLFAVVVAAATIGGLIGRFVRPHPFRPVPPLGQQTSADADASTIFVAMTTTLVDAAPLTAIPSNLPALPTGTFGIPINPPTEAISSCLGNNPAQQPAWGCMMGGYMSFNVTPTDYDTTQVTLANALPKFDGPTQYGPQPPQLGQPVGVNLMTDRDQPNLGPAYFFYQTYDKLVVLPEGALNVTKRKRSLKEVAFDYVADAGLLKRDQHGGQVQTGDKPWFCIWNNTILEGFIYITQDTNTNAGNVSNIIQSIDSTTTGVTTTPTPGSPAVSSLAAATATAAPTTATSASPDDPYRKEKRHHYRDEEQDGSNSPTDDLPAIYPKSVKLEERRPPNNKIAPTCRQMQVLDDLSLGPLNDANGNPMIVQLEEIEPASQKRVTYVGKKAGTTWDKRDGEEGEDIYRRDDAGSCRCVWMS